MSPSLSVCLSLSLSPFAIHQLRRDVYVRSDRLLVCDPRSFSELSVAGCEQLLHMPLCDVKMVPFDVAVVYRPKAGKLAIVYMTRATDSAGTH